VSSRQSVVAVEDWLLGTLVAPAREAGASTRRRLMTADGSSAFAARGGSDEAITSTKATARRLRHAPS